MRVLLLWAKRHRRRLRLSASLAAVTACILGGFWLAVNGLEQRRISHEISSFQVDQLRWPSEFRIGYGHASRLLDEARRNELRRSCPSQRRRNDLELKIALRLISQPALYASALDLTAATHEARYKK